MSAKGRKRQAARVKRNKVNKRENEMYYQSGSAWKMPAGERERTARRKAEV